MRPLIPTMKSNHGSMPSWRFSLRRTWNPNAPWLSLCEGASPSRREMKRLRALNIVLRMCSSGKVRVLLLLGVYGHVLQPLGSWLKQRCH